MVQCNRRTLSYQLIHIVKLLRRLVLVRLFHNVMPDSGLSHQYLSPVKSHIVPRRPLLPNRKMNHQGLVRDFCTKEIAELIEIKTKEIAKQHNWKIKKINLPLDIAIQTYYIIVYTEFFSATRKFDGRRFGKKIEESAGPEVIRRIIGGSEITKAEHDGKYYREALKAKNFIKQQFEKIFREVDAIILPTVPRIPHKIGETISVKDMYAYDVFTAPASIAGIPAVSIPIGKIDNKDIGFQILAPHFQEELIFKLAKDFE